MTEASSLTLDNTTLIAAQTAVWLDGGGTGVILTGGSISALGDAIDAESASYVQATGTTFSMVGGATSTTSFGVIAETATSVSLTNATIDGFTIGIEMQAGTAKVRSTTIANCGRGIDLVGGSLDLGTPMDPGANVLQTNKSTGLVVEESSSATTTLAVNAVGNTWIPKVQGTDANGQYTSGTLTGPYGTSAPSPNNVVIEQPGSKVVH